MRESKIQNKNKTSIKAPIVLDRSKSVESAPKKIKEEKTESGEDLLSYYFNKNNAKAKKFAYVKVQSNLERNYKSYKNFIQKINETFINKNKSKFFTKRLRSIPCKTKFLLKSNNSSDFESNLITTNYESEGVSDQKMQEVERQDL